VDLLVGNGDGTFQAAVTYNSGGYLSASVSVADVNGDSKPDLIVANGCADSTCDNGSAGVLLGNGDGTFQSAVNYSSGGQAAFFSSAGPAQVAVADVDGDGKPDLVLTNPCAPSTFCDDGAVSVLLGNGDGTFQTAVAYVSDGYEACSLAVADLNGDGKPDLIVVNAFATSTVVSYGTLGVFINQSNTIPTTTTLGSSPNPSNSGQTVIFTAIVTPQGSGTPTGPVNFFDGTQSLGSSSLNSAGVATLSTSTLAVGTHSITAMYSGDPNFGSSNSPVLSQVVQGAIVQLSPPSVNFGNVTVGGNGVKQGILVNLQNTGNIALTISSIAITGADPADFIQENLCPSSLAAGALCTITVQFIPTTTGTRNGTLTGQSEFRQSARWDEESSQEDHTEQQRECRSHHH
jgi:hypothetical protein